jgi:Protein-only RNase P
MQETKVDSKGKCQGCRLRLKPLPKLSADQFAELRDAFMEKSIMRNGNIFLNSTPEELDAYQKFLALHAAKPFDVVIDGLNVAHITKQTATRRQRDDVVCKQLPIICSNLLNFCNIIQITWLRSCIVNIKILLKLENTLIKQPILLA